jgi:signal recognition particle receptor subunit beta
MENSRDSLHRVLAAKEMQGCPVLVFANKQDLGVMTVEGVTDQLNMKSLKGHNWHVQGACGLSCDGIADGFNWLADTLQQKRSPKSV